MSTAATPKGCDDCGYPFDECLCTCPECGDGDIEYAQSACIDDLCYGGEVPCMHGDWSTLPCNICGK